MLASNKYSKPLCNIATARVANARTSILNGKACEQSSSYRLDISCQAPTAAQDAKLRRKNPGERPRLTGSVEFSRHSRAMQSNHMAPHIYHALLTRFNVRRCADIDSHVLSSEWLNARMKLFEQITIPSVAAQSQLPDSWLVFFDEETPQATRDYFMRLASNLSELRAEFCRGFNAEVCIERILRDLPPGTNWLLTTRLDNDDAINPRFIESVRSFVRPGVREFINPARGLLVANGKLYRKRDYSSPFITLSEPLDRCRTVLIDQHQRLSKHGCIVQLKLKDSWIQVIHGQNLANQVRGVRVLPKQVSMNVLPASLRKSVKNVSIFELILDNTFGLVRRYVGSTRRRAMRMLTDHKARSTC